jgi:hypothetical protein
MCCSLKVMFTKYSPHSVGQYAIWHVPSPQSRQFKLTSDGPSTVTPKAPTPAALVY